MSSGGPGGKQGMGSGDAGEYLGVRQASVGYGGAGGRLLVS